MKKILELAKKEINLIRSQKSVMLLIIIYPLLIVSSVMLALSGQPLLDNQIAQIGAKDITAVTYAGDSNLFDYNSFFIKMQDNNKLKLLVVGSEQEMRDAIRRSRGDVGFFVEPRNGKMDVNVYYDNVSPLAAEAILFLTTTKIQQIGEDLTKTELTNIWDELAGVETQLDSEKSKLERFISTLKESQPKLEKLKLDLESVDLESIRKDINFFDELSTKYAAQVQTAGAELSSSKQKLTSYEQDINGVRQDFVTYRLAIGSILSSIQALKEASVEPATTSLAAIEKDVNDQAIRIDSTIAKMDLALIDLNTAKNGIDSAQVMLAGATSDLNESKVTIREFSDQLESTSKVLEESKALIDDTIKFQENTISDLNGTSAFLNDFTEKIKDIRKKSPEALVRPVVIKENQLYNSTKMDVMLIVSLVIALLLTSILLTGVTVILEREQGISFRVALSKTNKLEWLGGKILGQLFFVLVITTIILGVAMFFAGVTISGSIIDVVLALLLIPFSFVCLSLAIARFANSFSTVVLSSLLIFIPMLLLSGLLFPTKLMPDIVAAFSSALPLTIAKDLLLDIMLRGLALDQIYGGLTTLFIYSVICLAIYFYGDKI
ncbi:MAG: ABC transporter permease [archaeon]